MTHFPSANIPSQARKNVAAQFVTTKYRICAHIDVQLQGMTQLKCMVEGGTGSNIVIMTYITLTQTLPIKRQNI